MPRNEAYRIPPSHVKIFQKQAKQLANGPYDCPKCGKKQLLVLIDKSNNQASIKCPSCGLEQVLKYAPVFQGVDYYNKFIDTYKRPA